MYGRGQKVANLRRAPTATVLVDVGIHWRELQGVMLRGEASILESKDEELADGDLAQAQLDLGRKHGLTGEDGSVKPYAPSAVGSSRRWIVFRPHTIVSWDNAKLPG